jgi:acetoin utilization deacetylase AcuC-like enzyme
LKLSTETAHGRVLLALEGGYNVDVLAECVEDVMTALVDEARAGWQRVGKRCKKCKVDLSISILIYITLF